MYAEQTLMPPGKDLRKASRPQLPPCTLAKKIVLLFKTAGSHFP
jgi:hypothetical protein